MQTPVFFWKSFQDYGIVNNILSFQPLLIYGLFNFAAGMQCFIGMNFDSKSIWSDQKKK